MIPGKHLRSMYPAFAAVALALNLMSLAGVIPGCGWRWIAIAGCIVVWGCIIYDVGSKGLSRNGWVGLVVLSYVINFASPFLFLEESSVGRRLTLILQVDFLWALLVAIIYNISIRIKTNRK